LLSDEKNLVDHQKLKEI